jgi:hypothetical protein
MPSDGWRSLVEKTWGDCVILHNLSLFMESEKIKPVKKYCVYSIYELQKSAKQWNFPDFQIKN